MPIGYILLLFFFVRVYILALYECWFRMFDSWSTARCLPQAPFYKDAKIETEKNITKFKK
jgi:hypothetical protein